MALGSTQSVTEMSTRNHHGGKVRQYSKADNLTTICEPNVPKMWGPQRLKTLWAFLVYLIFLFFFLQGLFISTLIYYISDLIM
jgi:hypothetical protein